MTELSLADKLRAYVHQIEADAAAGNAKAQQIITLYEMHRTVPADPAAPALCEATFKDWLKEKGFQP